MCWVADVQGPNGAGSPAKTRHSNVAPGSLVSKPHVIVVASVLSPSSGPAVIVVSGGPASNATVRVWSKALPARSVARTVIV